MEQKFNWAVISVSKNYIEVYDKRPKFQPAYSVLIKDVEIITNTNGTIFVSGEEIVFHFLPKGVPVSELDFTPEEHEIKRSREGFFRKIYVDYVPSGWIEDKETKKYEAKFCGYAIRFFVAGGVQVQ